MAPKKASLELAESSLRELMATLKAAKDALQKVVDRIDELELGFKNAVDEKVASSLRVE